MHHATFLVAILAFVPLASATAQEPPPVKVGDRVRVTAPDVRSAGIVQLLTTDSLVMHPEYVFVMRPENVAPNRLAIPLASVTRLELSMPAGSQAGQGALYGLAIGVFGGSVVGFAACEGNDFFVDVASTCALAGAVILGAGGALVGAILGAMISGTRWEEVPLDQLRVSFGPQRDGRLGFGLSVRF